MALAKARSAAGLSHIWILLATYFVSSRAHFIHNAAYIAYYPNLPSWISPDRIYVAWLADTAIGIAGLVAARLRLQAVAVMLIAIYGSLGPDGFAYYALAFDFRAAADIP